MRPTWVQPLGGDPLLPQAILQRALQQSRKLQTCTLRDVLMLSLKEWLKNKRRKRPKDEHRSGETGGENRHVDQQGEATRFDPPKLTQAVHLLSVVE